MIVQYGWNRLDVVFGKAVDKSPEMFLVAMAYSDESWSYIGLRKAGSEAMRVIRRLAKLSPSAKWAIWPV